jgi:hypothetical protein
VSSVLADVSTILVAIVLESIPFVLLGSLLSGIASQFLDEDRIRRLLPRSPWLAIPASALLGVVVPVCDCGVFPLARRLSTKGLPASCTAALLCAAPLLNPTVALSTAWAFPHNPLILWGRMIAGFAAAILAGVAVHVAGGKEPPSRKGVEEPHVHGPECSHEGHEHTTIGTNSKFLRAATATATDFANTMSVVVVGATAAAFLQTALPRQFLDHLAGSPILSCLSLMALAFFASICSNADAFVARSMMGIFPTGALLSFLIFGAMIDLKNLLLLLGSFRIRFVALVVASAAIIAFGAGLWVNLRVAP